MTDDSASPPGKPEPPATPEWFDPGLRFECTQCGNCCTGPPGYVWFNADEATRIARRLGLSVEQFLKQYTHRAGGRPSLNEVWNADVRGYDCVFLNRDERGRALCTIYDVRPTQCRTWPFWPENLRSQRAWRRASRDCPGMDQGQLIPADRVRIIREVQKQA